MLIPTNKVPHTATRGNTDILRASIAKHGQQDEIIVKLILTRETWKIKILDGKRRAYVIGQLGIRRINVKIAEVEFSDSDDFGN